MYRQSAGVSQLSYHGSGIPDIARSGQLDGLVALERIGTRLRFARNQEIYGQGESAGCWYKVISGTVRVSKLRTDGRRHIAEFCFSGDGFGLENGADKIPPMRLVWAVFSFTSTARSRCSRLASSSVGVGT